MARNTGTSTSSPATPPAVRASTPGWRDPRLWVGVVIVAGCVVAGAQVLASADDTVAVWSARADLGAGDELRAEDLVAERVRFADEARLADYFTVEDELPADLQLTRGIGAGELLARGAVGPAGDADTVQVPLAVASEQVPPSVTSGAVVDVYLVASTPPIENGGTSGGGAGGGSGTTGTTGAGGTGQPVAGPALSAVTVLDAPSLAEGFGATGQRQLVVAVPEEAAQEFFALLGTLQSPVITVVRRG